MMQRGRQQPGRGFPRSGWTKQDGRLVRSTENMVNSYGSQRQRTNGAQTANKQEMKTTKNQESEKTKNERQDEAQVPTNQRTYRTETDKVGKDWDEKGRINRNTNKSTEQNTRPSTGGLQDERTVLWSTSVVRTADTTPTTNNEREYNGNCNSTQRKLPQNSIPEMTEMTESPRQDINKTGVNSTSLSERTRASTMSSNTHLTADKKVQDMGPKELNKQQEISNITPNASPTKSMRKVKQEMIDDAIGEMEEIIMVDLEGQPDIQMEITEHNERNKSVPSSEQSPKEVRGNQSLHSIERTSPVSKRKSMMEYYNLLPKRQHRAHLNDLQEKPESSHKEDEEGIVSREIDNIHEAKQHIHQNGQASEKVDGTMSGSEKGNNPASRLQPVVLDEDLNWTEIQNNIENLDTNQTSNTIPHNQVGDIVDTDDTGGKDDREQGNNNGITQTDEEYTTESSDPEMEWSKIADELDKAEKTNSDTNTMLPQQVSTTPKRKQWGNFIRPKFKILLTNKTTEDTIHDRGVGMVESNERLTTPVSIEFNLGPEIREFNIITALMDLFTIAAQQDESFRVLQTGHNEVLWETEWDMPENKDFQEKFQMREQSFRTGNKKVTIYCVIESSYTINRLKYMDTMRQYLTEKNVWIKPDFYSTKVVSSPGFMIHVHPKLTNKPQLIHELKMAMATVAVDNTEEVVKKWKSLRNIPLDRKTEVLIPRFHVEITNRKWGDVQAEVINVQSSEEDAHYLKYLLSAASNHGKLAKGVFIPSGVHLMQNKELLTNVLMEQRQFIDKVTKFQLSGISRTDMYDNKHGGPTIQEIILDGNGVQAVEATFQTDRRGMWIVVVDKEKVDLLPAHLKQYMDRIYKSKSSIPSRLFTHQGGQNTKASFQIGSTMKSKVQTYADALRQRFGDKKPLAPTTQEPASIPRGSTEDTDTDGSSVEDINEIDLESCAKQEEMSPPNTQNTQKRIKGMPKADAWKSRSVDNTLKNTTYKISEQVEARKPGDKGALGREQMGVITDMCKSVTDKLEQAEQKLQQQMNALETRQQKALDGFESKLDGKIDHILRKELKTISLLMAETVTTKMMNLLKKRLPKTATEEENTEDKRENVTSQASDRDLEQLDKPDINKTDEISLELQSDTMMMAITEIEQQQQHSSYDSPHDLAKESSTNVS